MNSKLGPHEHVAVVVFHDSLTSTRWSLFEFFEYAKVAPLFARLSQHFEQCVYGLNLVKNELQEMQHPITVRAQEFLM